MRAVYVNGIITIEGQLSQYHLRTSPYERFLSPSGLDVVLESAFVPLIEEHVNTIDPGCLVGQDIAEQPHRGAPLMATDLQEGDIGLPREVRQNVPPIWDVSTEPVRR